ncbi:MAG: DUF3810 family protein [Bacteroidota bacterium]
MLTHNKPEEPVTPKWRSLRTWILPVLVVLTWFVNVCLPYDSQFVERWYSRGIFPLFRQSWDWTFGFSPVPLLYALLLLIGFMLIRSVVRSTGRWGKLWSCLRSLTLIFCALYVLFYWTWGFNYKRADVKNRLPVMTVDIDEELIFNEYLRVTDSLIQLRNNITDVSKEWDAHQLEQQVRHDLVAWFDEIELPSTGKVRVRALRPSGSLLVISTAGVYLPFVGEGHIDGGLHPITYPFTMMHEMTHGYGWTGEDVCNFFALMGTIRSQNPRIRYSGYMGYWRYLRANAFRTNKVRFRDMDECLDPRIKSDYRDIFAYTDRYPDIMPRLRDLIYDQYLKSHGIADGIVSYSAIVKLALAWQQSHGSLLTSPDN